MYNKPLLQKEETEVSKKKKKKKIHKTLAQNQRAKKLGLFKIKFDKV